MAKFTQVKHGDIFHITNGGMVTIECCDCSLVHDHTITYKRGCIAIKIERNEKATLAQRKQVKGARKQRVPAKRLQA